MVFAVNNEDDAAEHHVYTRCVERGRDEEEERLDDIWA